VASVLLLSANSRGSTSGVIQLIVDGEEVQICGVAVEFSFTRITVNNSRESSRSGQVQNGRFRFNRGIYGLYVISFSLAPSIWEKAGEIIYFNITFFNTDPRAEREFDIRVNVTTRYESMVEVTAGVGGSVASSGNLLIDPLGTEVSVRIPSP